MKTVLKTGAVCAATVMLAACANTYEVDTVAMMEAKGDAFAQALHKRYVERAQFEVGEGNWGSVGFFNSRAKMAAMGEAVAVQAPARRHLKVDAGAIASAYGDLTAALKTNAPQTTPDACARAQTWFEHWMEQAEEGHQDDHIAWTRGEYMKAIEECQGAKPMAMPMADMPAPLIVYFAHDSADVTGAVEALIERAVEAAKAAGATRAVLIGHTDRSGADGYNMTLSLARVNAVAQSLMTHSRGMLETATSHAGETSPQVATADGVKERMNRRVEVVFEK